MRSIFIVNYCNYFYYPISRMNPYKFYIYVEFYLRREFSSYYESIYCPSASNQNGYGRDDRTNGVKCVLIV